MAGSKHLIQCHCILPQYRNMDNPIFHKFVVFSKINEEGDIEKKLARCNNCGVIHSIVDMCKSELATNIEDTDAVITVDDIKQCIPERLCEILEDAKSDIATWEHVDDIYENKEWGSSITLTKQSLNGETHLNVLSIKGRNIFRIQTHVRQDDIKVQQ